MKGWLVNDTLTCIPGTKTFWHDLLENIPGLIDKTNGYTNFGELPYRVENYARVEGPPNYIIRNASFFSRINLNVPTISLLQDLGHGRLDVCNSSTIVVFNSPYTKAHYSGINVPTKIIPLGVDFDFFKPKKSYKEELGILDNSILFIGSSDTYPKGFDKVLNLINNTEYNFCLVMKDNFQMNHPRVKIFNRISHDVLLKVINSCSLLVCTSVVETQHLAGLEAAACDIPLVTTNVGVYYDKEDGEWGVKVLDDNFIPKIEYVMNNQEKFSPRKFFLDYGYNKKDCMKKWCELVDDIYG
jgi:glycosyltransferase involved in cell wall biosynthesis